MKVRSDFGPKVLPMDADSISYADRDIMLQLPETGPIASLIAGIALSMLKEGTEVPKLGLAVRTLVLVVLIPSVSVVSGLVTTVGNSVKFVTVDATVACSRFQMDQHS